MIDIQEVLRQVPPSRTFYSVEKLRALTEELRSDPRFTITIAGTSVSGVPIQHVRFGAGRVKALVVAGPHAMEPIGSVTVFSLMRLLQQGCAPLVSADVEWHIVPCIDPDGAILNEGWTQAPFTFANYMRNYHVQPFRDQVDACFPIEYKRLRFNQPSKEALILKELIDRIRPDFFFTLHNAWASGAFFFLTRDIGERYHQQLHELLRLNRVPIQDEFRLNICPARFGKGIYQMPSIRGYYDYLEKTVPNPEQVMPNAGANSYDYLLEIKESALTFVAELGYFRLPESAFENDNGYYLRQLMLKQDASNKFIASVIVEEWDRLEHELDSSSTFYKATLENLILKKERLIEGGLPFSRYSTRDVFSNPQFGRIATEGDLFNALVFDGGFFYLRDAYQFGRLLKSLQPTFGVRRALDRLERLFDEAIADIATYIDLSRLEFIDCHTLGKVQLGSGLIVLNAMLDRAL